MVLFNLITKGINKTIAPKLLRISLRIHQSIPSSAISLLPLSQRLVSIEVQDDYRQLGRPVEVGLIGEMAKTFDEYVERAWDVLGLEQLANKENQDDNNKDNRKIKQQHTKEKKLQTSTNHNTSDLLQMGHDRVELLQQYLLPALTPPPINPPHAFVKWIRGEYLIAKYGLLVQEGIRKHPELKDDAAGLTAFDVQTVDGKAAEFPLEAILPTVKTVRRVFDMEDWSQDKVPLSSAYKTSTNKNANQSLEGIIHNQLQGQIAHSGPFNAYFEMRRRDDSYELWTRDYIFGLARYLLQRIREMNDESTDDAETIVLDVGAGDGRLIYFLRRAMNEITLPKSRGPGRKVSKTESTLPTLIATDDGSWRAPIYKSEHIQVEQLAVVDALEKYAPNSNDDKKRLIVLCSWMPPGEDWTFLFRQPSSKVLTQQDAHKEAVQEATGQVVEYLLIGECDNGSCGHNWYTWGNHEFHPNDKAEDAVTEIPPYVADGYSRVDLDELSLLQLSRFDCKQSSESRTVSFRRNR